MQEQFVSKTRRKQEMLALQALGVALVALPDAQRAQLALPEALAQAVHDAKRFSSHEARRRQMQFIGRLMRDLDPAPIRAQLDALEGRSAAASAQHRRLEQWRARLVGDDSALTAFAAEHPGVDLQALRALIRNSRKEQMEARPPRAFRELFRFLKQCSSNP